MTLASTGRVYSLLPFSKWLKLGAVIGGARPAMTSALTA